MDLIKLEQLKEIEASSFTNKAEKGQTITITNKAKEAHNILLMTLTQMQLNALGCSENILLKKQKTSIVP